MVVGVPERRGEAAVVEQGVPRIAGVMAEDERGLSVADTSEISTPSMSAVVDDIRTAAGRA